MSNVIESETAVDPNFERERDELLQRASEKPTLRRIEAAEARAVEELEDSYPGLALFIEVTKEDFSKVYEGRLIATAQSSVEFLDLGKEYEQRGLINLTTYGKPLRDEALFLPPVFWLGAEQPD